MPLLDTSPLTDAGGGRAEWDMVPILKWCNEAPNRAEQSHERHRTITGKSNQRPLLPASGWMGEKGLRKGQEDCISTDFRGKAFWGSPSLPWTFGYMKLKRKKGKSWRKDKNVRLEAGALIIQKGRSEEWTWRREKTRKRVLCCGLIHSSLWSAFWRLGLSSVLCLQSEMWDVA